MSQSGHFLSRIIGSTLTLGILGTMGILTFTVLLPTIKDPESNIYGSSIGYPALKRLANEPINVKTVQAAYRTLEESVAAPGESVALQEVDVRPLVSGIVEQVYVVEGQRVRKGDPLLRIIQTPFQDQVHRARNNLAIAESDMRTKPELQQERLVELEANVESAQKKLALAESNLQMLSKLHQERFKALQADVESSQTQLSIAQERLAQLRPLQELGAVSHLEIFESRSNYTTRKNQLVSDLQQLAEARLDMTLDLNETQQEYVNYKKELVSAQQELTQAKNSIKPEIENTILAAENSKIELRQKIRDLNNTVIYADNKGLVSDVNIHTGEIAAADNPAITLTQDIVFKAYVDQARLNAVRIGDQATVRLVAYPGQSFQGKVIQLNPTVETDAPRSGKVGVNRQYTYSVWIQIDELQMPPGLQGYAQFEQSPTSLVIPETSFTLLSAGEGMVMVVEEGKAVVRKVKGGRKFDNQREVLAGLKVGEQVVLYPRAINNGDRLKIQPLAQ